MRKRLTAALVEKVLPPTSQPQVDYFDTILPAFGLRVGRRKKTWFVMVRVLKGGEWKLQRVTLGTTAEMDLAKARAEAREAMRRAEAGQPPAEVKRERREAQKADSRNTFATVVANFLKVYRTRDKRKPSPRTLAELNRVLTGELVAAWADRPIKAISEGDVQTVVDALVEKGRETAANRYLVYLRMLFGWARKRKLIESDPTADIDKPGAEHSRARVLNLEETKAIWKATAPGQAGRTAARKTTPPQAGKTATGKTAAGKGDLFASIVKVLLLTGQRRSEVAGMRWSELDLETSLWSLPGERCKNGRPHLVPLAAPVLAILEERKAEQKAIGLKDAAGEPTDLVFTSNGESPFSGWSRSKTRLDGRAKLGEPWTLHDLRRTLVTRMSEDLRVAPHVVEAVVNHVSGTRAGVAGVYNRALYLVPGRKLDFGRGAYSRWPENPGQSHPLEAELDPVRAD